MDFLQCIGLSAHQFKNLPGTCSPMLTEIVVCRIGLAFLVYGILEEGKHAHLWYVVQIYANWLG
jgi:hypothetical protein